MDYNWGDIITQDGLEAYGIFSTPPAGSKVLRTEAVLVDQDELLAPEDVDCTLYLRQQDGPNRRSTGRVDFKEGTISWNDFYSCTWVGECIEYGCPYSVTIRIRCQSNWTWTDGVPVLNEIQEYELPFDTSTGKLAKPETKGGIK